MSFSFYTSTCIARQITPCVFSPATNVVRVTKIVLPCMKSKKDQELEARAQRITSCSTPSLHY